MEQMGGIKAKRPWHMHEPFSSKKVNNLSNSDRHAWKIGRLWEPAKRPHLGMGALDNIVFTW